MLGLVLFGVENFDARYFFGCKISCSCIFLGSQYEAPSDPPPRHVFCEYPPGEYSMSGLKKTKLMLIKLLVNLKFIIKRSSIEKYSLISDSKY